MVQPQIQIRRIYNKSVIIVVTEHSSGHYVIKREKDMISDQRFPLPAAQLDREHIKKYISRLRSKWFSWWDIHFKPLN